MDYIDFITNTGPITLMELLAASFGTYYLKKGFFFKQDKWLVFLLWVTFFVEFMASYVAIGYFSDYEYFSFIKDTPFERNYWLYNIFLIFYNSVFTLYFSSFIDRKRVKLFFKYLVFGYVLIALLNIVFNDIFFKANAQFTIITGFFLVCSSIVFMYLKLIRSDLILKLKYFLPIYISVGALIFFLCTTPVDIFSKYFKLSTGNEVYVNLRAKTFLFANLFMYSTFIFGFVRCAQKKKSSY